MVFQNLTIFTKSHESLISCHFFYIHHLVPFTVQQKRAVIMGN